MPLYGVGCKLYLVIGFLAVPLTPIVFSSTLFNLYGMDKKDDSAYIHKKRARYQHFEKSLLELADVLKEFKKAGVKPSEILNFYQKSLTGEDIFSSRFYYDRKEKCYKLETNFPTEFEMFAKTFLE